MSSSLELSTFSLLAFDCFGTLIDDETGVWTALQPLFAQLPGNYAPASSKDAAYAAFVAHEVKLITAEPTLPYDKVLTRVARDMATAENIIDSSAIDAAAESFGQSVGSWPAFSDTVDGLRRLSKHYKLVILSNVDNASFKSVLDGPLKGAPIDAVYTAQDIGSYKPDRRNFGYLLKRALEEFGVERDKVLMVAQGLESDHVPCKEMGIKSVYIARGKGEVGEELRRKVQFGARFESIGGLATAVERLML